MPFLLLYRICTSKETSSSYLWASHTSSNYNIKIWHQEATDATITRRYALTINFALFCYILLLLLPFFAATLIESSVLCTCVSFLWECTASKQSPTLIHSTHVGSNQPSRRKPSILLDRQVHTVR